MDPYRLYFIHLPDCATCQATKPEVEAWIAARSWVKLVPLDLAETEWEARRWEPKITPTLVLLEPNGRHHRREHGATTADIEAWVAKVCPRALIRPLAAEAVVEPAK